MAVKKTDIRPIMSWGGLFLLSILLTGTGMVFLASAPYSVTPWTYVWGLILLIGALVAWLFFIKNLIVEAVVKALEIFHGRERQISKIDE